MDGPVLFLRVCSLLLLELGTPSEQLIKMDGPPPYTAKATQQGARDVIPTRPAVEAYLTQHVVPAALQVLDFTMIEMLISM